MYSWKLKMVCCQLKMYSWKLVWWKLKTIANELRSTWHNPVLLLATRCLYWGYIRAQVKWTQLCNTLGHLMPLVGRGYIWKLKMVFCKLKTYSWKLKMIYWQLKTMENELRWNGHHLVPLLATRCIYWGVHVTKGQHDPEADQISSRPDIVPLLSTRCLHWGYIWAQVNWTYLTTTLGH